MPKVNVAKTLARELVLRQRVPRIPEPDLVMDDPDKVAAYTRAGRVDGVMAPVYLFHCAQICQRLSAGDTAVDLGCGPATQLSMVAALNPDCQFIGVDMSDDMLERAADFVAQENLENVSFRKGDMTRLDSFEDNSVDTVFSTVALHHLPDVDALERTIEEAARILKPGGGLYLLDFGRLKSEQSMREFAYQYAEVQAELFTLDYLYSLQAAFTHQDFQRLCSRYLGDEAKVNVTFGMPFMLAVNAPRSGAIVRESVQRELEKIRDNLPRHHKVDFKNLKMLFRLGGLPSPLL